MFKTISLFFFLTATLSCCASSLSLTGSLNPNDVLLVAFQLSSATHFTFQSYGYGGTSAAPGGTNLAGTAIAPGGFDPLGYSNSGLRTGGSGFEGRTTRLYADRGTDVYIQTNGAIGNGFYNFSGYLIDSSV